MPNRILVVDDSPLNVKLLHDILATRGYVVTSAASGHDALDAIAREPPDLVLLDVLMPGMSGFEVCGRIRANARTALLPVVMVTALHAVEDRIAGLEAGADDFLTKPFNKLELLARVRSLLRIKSLYDQVDEQKQQLAKFNQTLEQRVADGVAQLDRFSTMKRFFSAEVAALILAGAGDPMKSHRSTITVVFLDLRGFTAFTENADPDAVMGMLREYHSAMGSLITAYNGTVEHFAGDGIMIIFNDPLPIEKPAHHAVRMALDMHLAFEQSACRWRLRGYDLGLGIGIAQGQATIGTIGYEGRLEYCAIGSVCNLSSRLCSEARGGQTLVPHDFIDQVADIVEFEHVGKLALKGYRAPVVACNVTSKVAAKT
jgi:class 3 adenylate cyclase/CheY-like chemotaxis protein